MTKFTLYWVDGHISIEYGNSVSEVFTKLGGVGAALDFYISDVIDDSNDHRDYRWNTNTHEWEVTSNELI